VDIHTNHAQVLLAIARRRNVGGRDIVAAAAITERYAGSILRDLEDAGYVRRRGRGNLYRIHRGLALGDPIVEEHALRELLRLIEADDGDDAVTRAAARAR
jgi:DNA-binding IclR family transcriptional regulator